MAKRFLITRAEEDGAATAARLAALGHAALEAPLLQIRYLPEKEIEPLPFQAVLITSANGARGLSRYLSRHPDGGELFSLTALAVGDRSAAAARDAGFFRVLSADGDVTTLAALIRAELDAADGPLLHVAGTVTAGDLAGELRPDGYEIARAVLYEAVTAQTMPDAAREALENAMVDGIFLYSPRTARTFAALVDKAGLGDTLNRLTAYCLSPAVATALDSCRFDRVLVASTPTEDALLALLAP